MAPEHEDSFSVLVAWFCFSHIKEFFRVGGMVESFLHSAVESFSLSMWHGSSQALNREFVQKTRSRKPSNCDAGNYQQLRYVKLLHFLQS